MLSVFPDFIFLGVAFSPFVIRLLVAYAIGSLALYHMRRTGSGAALVRDVAPWLSNQAPLIARVGPYISMGVAILLFIGLLTQVAALVAAILSLKMMYFKKKYPNVAPESRNFYLMLFVLSLLLVFAGAGPFAFDIPL